MRTYQCSECGTEVTIGDGHRCRNRAGVTEHEAHEAVFIAGSWRVVVAGQLQRPDFNSKGAALAFGSAVAAGTRKAEPCSS